MFEEKSFAMLHLQVRNCGAQAIVAMQFTKTNFHLIYIKSELHFEENVVVFFFTITNMNQSVHQEELS